jgi:PAS domain S-box-containing protein
LLGIDKAPPDFADLTLPERLALFAAHDERGRPLGVDEGPLPRALRGEILSGAETMNLRSHTLDGREVELNVSAAPLRDKEGHVTGAVAVLRDQTERKQLEQALHESEARYRGVVESQTELISRYLPDTTLTFVNEANCRAMGLSQEQLVGTKFLDLMVESEREPVQAMIRSLLEHPGVSTIEHQVRMADGSLRWQQWVNRTILDDTGQVIELQGVGRDVTERKQLEQERAEQAEQLDRIFEHIADGLLVHNAQGQPVRLNAAARRILGLDVAPGDYAQLPASDRATLYEAHDEQGRLLSREGWPLMRMLSGEVTEPHTREMRLRTLNGHEVEVIYSLAPLRDQEGHVVGAVTILHDQSEQKRLAREREEARAHELALEDTTRHMDEFLATASHDLRTPLTVVKTRLQMALRRLTRLQESEATAPPSLAETDREALQASLLAANQSGDRLVRLVDLLFDVSRARSGTLELELGRCDLAALVREQVAAQQMATPDRTIDLILPGTQSVWAQADADRLGQVLSNYLSNALKYSRAEQPVMVQLEVSQNQAVVKVSDHGPGLPEEEQSHIWEWFYRVPGILVQYESGESSGSLGLGLHICRQMVELHPGGSVGVESQVGKGSTFWFRLPVARYAV